jgi:hypothetical protein
MTSYLYFNTRDRDEGEFNDMATFYVNKSQLRGTKLLTLESISLQHTMVPFSPTRCNNILYVQTTNDATTYEAVIPANNYNSTEFVTTLTSALDSATGDSWSVSYDTQSGKLTLNTNGPTFRIVSGECSAHAEVGWDLEITGFQSGATVLHTPLNLSGTQYVDVVTNMSGLSYNSTGTYTVLVRIPVRESFGEIIIYNSAFKHSIMTRGSMDQVTLGLRDDRGRRLGLDNNSYVSYAFMLENVVSE